MKPRTHNLFAAEARLRAAAEGYATWTTATNRTRKILDEARAELRAAAIAFADLAREADNA